MVSSRRGSPVLSGVPEGSICGPLLFTCFTADIPLCVKSGCTMYADDVKLHKLVRCEDDARALQSDIDSLAQWSRAWKLRLNPTKCHGDFIYSACVTNLSDLCCRWRYFGASHTGA